MFYLIKSLSALVLPPIGLVIPALVGLLLMPAYPDFGAYLVAFALLALVALSLPFVADALIHTLEWWLPISAEQIERVQAVVILGAGVCPPAPEYGDDSVNYLTLERLRYGVFLHKSYGLPILATGGAPNGGTAEGVAMKRIIEGEFMGRVAWVECQSRDTAENARFSANLLRSIGISRIALVSHGWHLPRAVELFERHGFEVFPAPTCFISHSSSLFSRLLPSSVALEKSSYALHEWLGIFVQRLKN